MTSNLDVNFPVDNVKVSKATQRAQNTIIYNELSALQTVTGVASEEAFSDTASLSQVRTEILKNAQKSSLPQDIAYGNVVL
jgi:hypothetical protein|tara:strand:+ start:9215 stop:9457 length:243 start_codon:yes stop_codon:yes gene_type:complete